MAKHILYDASVTVNGTDLSDHVESVEYTLTINEQAAAAMSEDEDYDMPGTKAVGDIVINYYQDYAASEVWATHKALYTARSTFPLIVKPTSAADSATNPAFTKNVFVKSMPAVSGTRGQRHMAPITYRSAGALTIDET